MNEIKNEKYWIRQQDNLEFMKELESETVDLLYSDILYSTGRKFKDYDDNLWKSPQEAMEWYKPRLIEMKRILKNTGSIYLQCDYRLVHYLKVLMDEVFGIKMFLNEIIWCYKQRENANKKGFNQKHDNILVYTKTNDFKFNQIFEEYNPDYIKKSFKKDKNGRLQRKQPNGKGGYYIQYLDESKGQPVRDWWEITPLTGKGGEMLGYQTQKPKAILERIIKASSNEGDTVLDVFAGSHTTGEVALELGRYYIGCDIGDKSFDIGKDRLINKEEL